jgi:beta-glucuronidase
VSFADDNLPKLTRADQSAANDADFLMMNEYFGAWHGAASELVPALDRVNALFPDKMVIVSEFGYPGIFSHSPQEADQARIRILQEQLPVLASRDWIGGAILWCYQDYKSRRNLWPGQTEGYVEHGLVDEARQRKPSYEVWKALTAPAHVEARWIAGSDPAAPTFEATIAPNGEDRLPHQPLHDYRITWDALDAKGASVQAGTRRFESLASPVQIREEVAHAAERTPVRLVLRLIDSNGDLAEQRSIAWPPTATPASR